VLFSPISVIVDIFVDWRRLREREKERRREGFDRCVCVCYICVTHGETVSTEPGEFWFLIERGVRERGFEPERTISPFRILVC